MSGLVDRWVGGWVDRWVGGWVDGWMGGWMDGWMDGWVSEWGTRGIFYKWVRWRSSQVLYDIMEISVW